METTLVQKLMKAVLALAKNPDSAEEAEKVQKLAAEIAPLWVKADKGDVSVTRSGLVTGWIVQAGTSPKLAIASTKTTAAALLTLMVVLDGAVIEEAGWMDYAKGGDVVPELDEVAKVAGVDPAVTSGEGGGMAIAIGVGVLALIGVGAAVALGKKKKKRAA